MMLLSPRVWLELAIAALVASVLWWGYNAVYDRGAASVQTKWDAEVKAQAEASAKVAADALATTKALQASADKRQGESNAQIKTLSTNLGIALDGLRQRPSRGGESSVPGNPGAASVCTGASLPAEDAEFLARESARADRLRIRLESCEADYEAARNALK